VGAGTKILWLAGIAAVVAIGAAASPETAEKYLPGSGVQARKLAAMLPFLSPSPAVVPTPAAAPQRPPVIVTVGKAERKSVTLRIDSIGTVQTVSSVVLRPRVDSQIDKILISDGAVVKAGDTLVKLDSRQVEAQIQQAIATIAKDQAQLEQAQRDVVRYTDLVAKQATTQINLDTAKTQVALQKAAIIGDQAALDNLKVQLTYYTISAPISGRVGTIALKAGSMARASEAGTAPATINQMSPIYVAFSVRQDLLSDVRAVLNQGSGSVIATPQGSKQSVTGKIAVIDNAIDPTTGTISVKATFDNNDETLWPGQLCTVRVNLRDQPNIVTVPSSAVQSGQIGNFVYVIENDRAKIVPVKAGIIQDGEMTILSGLNGGETVVVDGALLLSNGAAVTIRKAS